jgi:hypothetical protein
MVACTPPTVSVNGCRRSGNPPALVPGAGVAPVANDGVASPSPVMNASRIRLVTFQDLVEQSGFTAAVPGLVKRLNSDGAGSFRQ